MTGASGPESPMVDAERLRAVVLAIGAERTRTFLALIDERLAAISAAAKSPRERAAQIHQCAGSAASLGLLALEAALRAVEHDMIRAGDGAEDAGIGEALSRLAVTYEASWPWILRAAPTLADRPE